LVKKNGSIYGYIISRIGRRPDISSSRSLQTCGVNPTYCI